ASSALGPNRPAPRRGLAGYELLAVEVRARMLLVRRPAGRAGPENKLGRSAQLSGPELLARRGPGRRRRAVLPLERQPAGNRGSGRGGRGRPPRPVGLRPWGRTLRPQERPGEPDVVSGHDPRGPAGRPPARAAPFARGPGPGGDGIATQGEP